MTYLRTLDSAVKFNKEAVETLSENVKDIMLDANKWMDEKDIAIHWFNYTLYNQSSIFTYVCQLEFAILELRSLVKRVFNFFGLYYDRGIVYEFDFTCYVKEYFKNVTLYFPDAYTLCVSLQRNNIKLFYEFMEISVFADYHSVKLVMLIPSKTFERHFYLYKLITFPYKISKLDNFIQLTAEYDNLVLDD